MFIPLLVLVLTSILVRVLDLDLGLQRVFWSPAVGWSLRHDPFVLFLYHYGTWPASLAATGGLALWLVSRFAPRLKTAGSLGGFLALALVLGPGLVVNATLKDHYGRPRPRDTIEFGGSEVFRPLGEPTFGPHGKSFPSGHSAMGFFWFAPCIFLWQHHRRLALGFATIAVVHGGLMSFARMAQGAHWLSDHLWAAGVLYITFWVLHALLISVPSQSSIGVRFASSDRALPSAHAESLESLT
jgi:membrane-associated PAP2 superfamily phosphatase